MVSMVTMVSQKMNMYNSKVGLGYVLVAIFYYAKIQPDSLISC